MSYNETLVLVTAAHIAEETKQNTQLLFRLPGHPSCAIQLAELSTEDKLTWRSAPNNDLATLVLKSTESNRDALSRLKSIAISCESLLADAPARTTEVEITGFPMALGIRPSVSPLVMKGYVASRETNLESKSGTENVFFALPTVGAGCSGGPVFLSSKRQEEVQVAGMYVGLVFDDSGVKLSKVVPAEAIKRAVKAAVFEHSATKASDPPQ